MAAGLGLAVLLQAGQAGPAVQPVCGPGQPQQHPLAVQVERHLLSVHHADRECDRLTPGLHQLRLQHRVDLPVRLFVILKLILGVRLVVGLDRFLGRNIPQSPVVEEERSKCGSEKNQGDNHCSSNHNLKQTFKKNSELDFIVHSLSE